VINMKKENVLQRLYYSLHPNWVTYSHAYVEDREQVASGIKHWKYRTVEYRNIESGDTLTLKKYLDKKWIEWDDGSKTTLYRRRTARPL